MTPSGIFRAIDAGTKTALRWIVFLIVAAVGFGTAASLAETSTRACKTIPTFAYVAGAVGAFGLFMLPDVWDHAKPIFVFFFPNGIPILGGRRSSDPPAPPAPPKP